MAISKDIERIISLGSTTTFTCDPQQKDEITKSTLNAIARETKSHLLRKKKVHVVLVKE